MTEKDKSTVLLEYSLKKLKLPTMLREYAALATVCQKDRSDYPTYLLRLTERELLDREKRAAERRIKDANFPVIKTIDTYDFGAQPSINEPLVRELLRGSTWTKKKTCSSSEIRESAKRTWSVLWPSPLVPKAETFASIRPRTWSPSSWSAGKKKGFSDCIDSFRDSICW